MDLLQVTLIIVLAVLSINFVIVAVFLILVLKELRDVTRKINAIVGTVQDVAEAVVSPVSVIAGIVSGVADSLGAVKSVSNLFGKKERR